MQGTEDCRTTDLNRHLEKFSVGILFFNGPELRVRKCNSEALKILGLSSEAEILNKPLDNLLPELPKKLMDAARKVSQEVPVYEAANMPINKTEKTVKCIVISNPGITFSGALVLIDEATEALQHRLYETLIRLFHVIWSSSFKNESEFLKYVVEKFHYRAGFPAVVAGEADSEYEVFLPLAVKAESQEISKIFTSIPIKIKKDGEGVICAAYQRKEPILAADVQHDPKQGEWREYYQKYGAEGIAAIPLIVEDNVKYILVLYGRSKDIFTEKYRKLYKDIQTLLSLALEHIRLSIEREHISNLYNLLYRITSLSLRIDKAEDLLDALPDLFNKYLKTSIAILFTVKDNKLKLKKYAIQKELFKRIVFKISTTLVDRDIDSLPEELNTTKALTEKKLSFRSTVRTFHLIQSLNDTSDIAEFTAAHTLLLSHGIRTSGAFPIVKKGEVVAVVVIFSETENFFTPKVRELMELLREEIEFFLFNIETQKFNKLLLKALDTGFDFVSILDANFRFIYVNKSFSERSGYAPEELIGKHHSIFSSKVHSKEFTENFYKTLTSGKAFSDYMVYRIKNGTLVKCYVTIIPYKDNGKITHYICVGKDVTKDEDFLRETIKFVYYDPVTQLPNLKQFTNEVQKYTEENLEHHEKSMALLAIVDPGNFGMINQVYGFEAGNYLLKEIGQRVKGSVYKSDLVGRMESDAIAIFLKDLKNLEAGIFTVERILNSLSNPFKLPNGQQIHIEFRTGISVFPHDGTSAKEIMDAARAALTEAKNSNVRMAIYSPKLREKSRKALQIRNEIIAGIKKKKFTFLYQPIVDVQGRIRAAECLVRWRKGSEILTPGTFLPYIKGTRLAIYLEEYLTKIFLERLKSMYPVLLQKDVRLSFNISPDAFQRSIFTKLISEQLRKDKRIGRCMTIEITEESFLKSEKKVLEFIETCKESQVKICIDDFGTGYSALGYLVDLPVDIMKLDLTLTRNACKNERAYKIVEAVVSFCRGTGITVVAEGIETPEQFETMKKLGCELFQGYLFYKPMDKGSFLELLENA